MTIDRRLFLASAAATLLPLPAFSQEAASDGFRILRPKALAGDAPARLSYGDDETPLVLRLAKGEELKVRLVNALAQETTIHWRGMRGPNAMDGTPLVQKPVSRGASFDYRFTPPDAGTFLFQPHAETTFAAQAQLGLGGVLVVEDPAGQKVDHDIVAALADRAASIAELGPCGDGRAVIMHTNRQMAGDGLMGTVVTVNGRPAPEAHSFAPRARVRLRLANLSTSRLMAVSFEGVQPNVIAVDGQNCPAFEPLRNVLPLAPGGRFDVMFDMPEQEGAGARVALLGAAPEGGWDGSLLALKTEGRPVEARPPVADPAPNNLLSKTIALQKAHRAELAFEVQDRVGESAAMCAGNAPSLWRINGKPGADSQRLFGVRRGTPVSLGLTNKSPSHVVIRLHGHVMRQLHLMDDGWDPYWRDAVVVPAGRTVHVAFVADNPGRWRIGGGILPQALGGLAGFFEVT